MTANRDTGLRIERAAKPMGRTNAGRFFIPLQVITDGEPTAETNLVLTGTDTEQLLGELSRLLSGGAEPHHLDPVGGAA
ncbi:hypothetical protein ACH4NC_07670 [Streptomyces sp. NPDC017201]|uniref:hypothetical protein n=1 Tax=unclassified Streptomyces TaxID=2593676 RepID=UPI00344235F4